jgi:tetratricopeptide (TPR) repeat protein
MGHAQNLSTDASTPNRIGTKRLEAVKQEYFPHLPAPPPGTLLSPMSEEHEQPAWRASLDAITGARHGGRTDTILDQLKTLDQRHPNVAEIAYQLAWTLDTLGRDAEARPHYDRALALGLPPNEHSGALIGLGTVCRNLGELDAAAEALESGQRHFPEQPEFDAYLALVRHDQGRHAEALQLAMNALLDTSEDPGITARQRDLRHFVSQLN